ncbi:MAG: Rne/Rng family ribonuclease [Deltaproteobacteria bacterium]
MENLILVNVTFNETRVAVTENGTITEFYLERKSQPRIVGNIYKGKVTKIVPGMQAAFVDLGLERSGFISVEDVYEDSFLDIFLDDEELQTQKKRYKYPIQDVLRDGQEILVQVLKESTGGKGAKLSSYVALPGKYLVLFGTVELVGVSRRIEDKETRKRLSEIIRKSKPKGIGFVARTASMGRDEDEIRQDMEYLINLWDEINKNSEELKAPALLYEEPSLYIRAVRDMITPDVKSIIVDSKEAEREIASHMKSRFPSFNVNIEMYAGKSPIFTEFGVEEQLKKFFEKKVWLKSGGYLIIEEAEALTVVDINTGRYLSGNDHEETIFNINMEAAQEVARQIRMRNLVGIIVIDFIDLKSRQKRDEVFRSFVEAMKKDKARSVVLDMTSFGVVQMTRQRTRESILKSLSEPCEVCGGMGYVKSKDTITYEIIRGIRNHAANPIVKKIHVQASHPVIKTIKEVEGENLRKLADESAVAVLFEGKESRADSFQITTNK